MTTVERNMFTFYLKRIVSEYRRPAKEPKNPPSTDVIFEKVPIKYEQLESYLLMKKKTKVYNILKNIYDEVSSLCEGANSKFVWESTLFILKLFHDKDKLLLEHNRELERLFGVVEFSSTERFFKAVKELQDNFEDDPHYLRLGLGGAYEEPERYYEQKTLPSLYISERETNIKLPSETELKSYERQLVRRIKALELAQRQKAKLEKNVVQNASDSSVDFQGDCKTWILNLIEKYGNPGLVKHIDRFIDILRSNRDDNEIQEELVNFIGFENITLAEVLLKNRATVKRAVCNAENGRSDSKPALSAQVVVQTKQEKSLAKKLSKLQKKQGVLLDATCSVREQLEYEQIKEEYAKAKKAPLLRRSVQTSGQSLPNVYDAQKTNRFAQVSTSKTSSIPANAIRKDTNTYEEFEIPAHEKKEMLSEDNLIKIDSLDRVSQVIFSHIKTLNIIQSLVFPIAYATNENMLICAPTGAGKTNTALLAVTHQIMQHTTEGVINLKDFKIVYVCPMKALSAEMASSFGKRLKPLGLKVREVTGDMQVSPQELMESHMIVTTPEKWDIITRKGGTNGFVEIVKLLIIDEVHLLAGDRGPVIEALVARTLRQVESSQKMIRIIGLSATLPNYTDVANFLRVTPRGLFYFDSRFRPVPLRQHFIGVKADRPIEQMNQLDLVCFEKVKKFLADGHQCIVFVHTRNQTGRTANFLKMEAQKTGVFHLFEIAKNHPKLGLYQKKLGKSSNPLLIQLLNYGLGIHNAGMARTDRDIMEECFREGLIRVLCTTSTLAWGVNLPAHAVIIKGTELYSAAHGGFTDLDMLDVLQIFGRAGRPQYDTSGTAMIITKHDKMYNYMRALTHQVPIESKFLECLVDNLNAEIVLGTVTNEYEGVEWLRYTYLYQRLVSNPYAYGIDPSETQDDVTAEAVRRRFIQTAAVSLQRLNMVRYNAQNGDFSATTMGRIASIYYLRYSTVSLFTTFKYDAQNDETLFDMMAHATEFKQIKTREDEFKDLDELMNNALEYNVPGFYGNDCAKVNILMQSYISRVRLFDPTLVSEQAYIVQNVLRIARALFEIGLLRNNFLMAEKCLNIAKMFEQQVWDHETPLRQFPNIPVSTCSKIERKNLDVDHIRELDVSELERLIRDRREHASLIKRHAQELPHFEVESSVQPITRTVIRVVLTIKPLFTWNPRYHGPATEHFVIWIVDQNEILHSESFVFRKKQVLSGAPVQLVFSLRLPENPPTHFVAKICSERWLGATHNHFISFRTLLLPSCQTQPTNLLTLQPLPISALKNRQFESMYTSFTHFNPIQTQVFFCLYNTDNNVLIGAPTGSGKTIMSELAILRLMKNSPPQQKVVYVAPMKALVRERVEDWIRKFAKLDKKVIEVTGDVTPTPQQLNNASIIITTPEKWDSLSRGWQGRNYVQQIGLMIIDEIHLLGEDRGPVLEVIVSRTNYIAAKTGYKIRLLGLSTSMANASDLARWLNIAKVGMFNFRSSVRPVPIEVHMGAASGKHYCPRMKAMNKPTYQSIRQYSPSKPSLVFVSSRRQTRLTAQDLVGFLGASDNPRQWLRIDEDQIRAIVQGVKDPNLKLFLPFGIGTHHAGLEEYDRKIVEKLFLEQKIQVLIATATLAWGVNFPAHLVVVKGTEYFDGKKRGYTDMPVTDVLQMVGRAGRPQFDDCGVAVVLVHDIKKNFYKRFLYEPFPIESNLLSVLPDHINAEITNGSCSNKVKIFEYLTWTFFYQRLSQSPSYYNLHSLEFDSVKEYLEGLIDQTIMTLVEAGCVEYDERNDKFISTFAGSIASFYYLSYKTIRLFNDALGPSLSIKDLLLLMCSTQEYSEFPVRHNEEHINEDLEFECRMRAGTPYEAPETKVFLLLQAHFSRLKMPIPDYKTDLKMVLQQALRILQAMVDYCSSRKWLRCTLRMLLILQMIVQGSWADDSPFKTIADVPQDICIQMDDAWLISDLSNHGLSLIEILQAYKNKHEEFVDFIYSFVNSTTGKKIEKVLGLLPRVGVAIKLIDCSDKDEIVVDLKGAKAVTVKSDRRYSLQVELVKDKPATEAFTPKFTKVKEEGWSIVLGCKNTDRLIAIKRLSPFKRRTSCKLDLELALMKGGFFSYSLFVLSDCYLGMDQEYNFTVQA